MCRTRASSCDGVSRTYNMQAAGNTAERFGGPDQVLVIGYSYKEDHRLRRPERRRDVTDGVGYRIRDHDDFFGRAVCKFAGCSFCGLGYRRDQPATADGHVKQQPFEYPAFDAGSTVQKDAVMDSQQWSGAMGETRNDIMNISRDMINIRLAFTGCADIAENIGRRSPGKRCGPFNDGQFPANERDDLPEDTFYNEDAAGFSVE